MDFALNDEQRMYQEAVRAFCEREIKPYAAEVDKTAQLRMDSVAKMPDLGLTGLQVPEEYGGANLDSISTAIAMEELGRVCGSTGLSVEAHNELCCMPIVRWGTSEQKEQFLPHLTSGKVLGSIALTEPGSGSDLMGTQTRAVKDGDSWIINGSKAWITNASLAPVIVTLVKTSPAVHSKAFSMIQVETDRVGLHIAPPEKKMGTSGSPAHALTFDNVRVPLNNLLGEEGHGLQQTLATLDSGRIAVAALCVGLAQAAFDVSLAYAQERRSFGQRLADHQAIQFKLADAATQIEAARLLVYRAAWAKDQGETYTKLASMAKVFASEAVEYVAFEAIQIYGGYGYSREFPLERIYRDQRILSIGEGTSEINRMVIARRLLAG
ncbi:MAG TPA: acyl-CoA dehydrogenase family protein [Aggregatilineaceae bacterium]|nr:acyl-CoA dehydrogenase family protein [Aggregatilineaceae bacterium]